MNANAAIRLAIGIAVGADQMIRHHDSLLFGSIDRVMPVRKIAFQAADGKIAHRRRLTLVPR